MLPMSKSLMRDVCRVHGIGVEPNDSGARMLRRFLYMDNVADTKPDVAPVSSVLCEETWRNEQHALARERKVKLNEEELDRRWKLIISRKTSPDDVIMDTDLYESLSSDEKQSLTLVVRTRTSCYLRPSPTEAAGATGAKDMTDSQEQAEIDAAIEAVENFKAKADQEKKPDAPAMADKVPDEAPNKQSELDLTAKEKLEDATSDDEAADDSCLKEGQYTIGDTRLREDGRTEILCSRQIVCDGVPCKGMETFWMLKTEHDATVDEAQSAASANDDAAELATVPIAADDLDTPAEGADDFVADESERPAKKARVEADEGGD